MGKKVSRAEFPPKRHGESLLMMYAVVKIDSNRYFFGTFILLEVLWLFHSIEYKSRRFGPQLLPHLDMYTSF